MTLATSIGQWEFKIQNLTPSIRDPIDPMVDNQVPGFRVARVPASSTSEFQGIHDPAVVSESGYPFAVAERGLIATHVPYRDRQRRCLLRAEEKFRTLRILTPVTTTDDGCPGSSPPSHPFRTAH